MIQNPEYSEDSPTQSFHLSASSVPTEVTLGALQVRHDGSLFAQQLEGSEMGSTDVQAALPFVARSLPKRRPDDRIPAYMPRVALSTPLPLSRDVEDRITSLGPVYFFTPFFFCFDRAKEALHLVRWLHTGIFMPLHELSPSLLEHREKVAALLRACSPGCALSSFAGSIIKIVSVRPCMMMEGPFGRRCQWSRRRCCGWG